VLQAHVDVCLVHFLDGEHLFIMVERDPHLFHLFLQGADDLPVDEFEETGALVDQCDMDAHRR
jgi:hypothetical protein